MLNLKKLETAGALLVLCAVLVLTDPFLRSARLEVAGALRPALRWQARSASVAAGFLSRLLAVFSAGGEKAAERNRQLRIALGIERYERARLARKLANDISPSRLVEFRPRYCSILYRDPTYAREAFVLDVGRKDGVREGMALCSGMAVVGRIYAVASRTCIAVTLRHPACRVPVRAGESGARGVCRGDGKGVRLEFVPFEAALAKGDPVVTSGETGFFPPGLFVGDVRTAERDRARLLWNAAVTPNPALAALEDLYIPLAASGVECPHIPREVR